MEIGDIGIVENGAFYHSYYIVRILKVGKVMAEIERYRPTYVSREGGWERPCRQKLAGWVKLPAGADLDAVSASIRQISSDCQAARNSAVASQRAAIAALGESA